MKVDSAAKGRRDEGVNWNERIGMPALFGIASAQSAESVSQQEFLIKFIRTNRSQVLPLQGRTWQSRGLLDRSAICESPHLIVSFAVSDISHVLWELITKACVLNSIDRILIWRVI